MNIIFLILLQVSINASAQLFLKKGVVNVDFQKPCIQILLSLMTNVQILIGTGLFVFGFFCWLYLLSKLDLSFVYPMSSLAIVITSLFGYFFLSETISITRALGIFLIIIGVFFVSKT